MATHAEGKKQTNTKNKGKTKLILLMVSLKKTYAIVTPTS